MGMVSFEAALRAMEITGRRREKARDLCKNIADLIALVSGDEALTVQCNAFVDPAASLKVALEEDYKRAVTIYNATTRIK
jgi:hypothetical protein